MYHLELSKLVVQVYQCLSLSQLNQAQLKVSRLCRIFLFSTFMSSFSQITGVSDYQGGSFMVEFAAGETELFVDIPIINDNVLEAMERFTATLTSNTPNVDIESGADSAIVIIIDDDSEY